MLSKFYYESSNERKQADTLDVSALANRIKDIYLFKSVTVERIFPGGTLGIFFKATVDGRQFFIKTCAADEMSRHNLHKEAEIMKVLYGDTLNANYFVHCNKEFIIMDFVDTKNTAYEMDLVSELIRNYNLKLTDIAPDIINYNLEDLHHAASYSFDVLSNANLLSAEVGLWWERIFEEIKEYDDGTRIICHGDLSNVNITDWNGDVLVLDWEDAMMAYPQYDILYWLTFYSQRKYYSCHLLNDIGVEVSFGKNVMAMILLIKCYLSYRNKSFLNNKLSINDRINEIICM